MAVDAFVSGFEPELVDREGSSVFRQLEAAAFSRLSQHTKKAIQDLRLDSDDGFKRAISMMAADPDLEPPANLFPVGVRDASVFVDPANADLDIDFGMVDDAEPGRTAPVKATLTVGLVNAAVDFECRFPGNGAWRLPNGIRTLLVYEAEAADQALSYEQEFFEIDGRWYNVIVVHLETIAGVIQTTAENIADACTYNDVAEDLAISTWLSASLPGTGADPVVATTEPQQFVDGEGGLYLAYTDGVIARVLDWDIGTKVTVNIDGTAVVPLVINFDFIANGILSTISVPVQ